MISQLCYRLRKTRVVVSSRTTRLDVVCPRDKTTARTTNEAHKLQQEQWNIGLIRPISYRNRKTITRKTRICSELSLNAVKQSLISINEKSTMVMTSPKCPQKQTNVTSFIRRLRVILVCNDLRYIGPWVYYIHSLIEVISIAPLREALQTQHG